MDYDEFYQPFKLKEKSMKENYERQQTVLKSMSRNADKGDLKSFAKDLTAMGALISEHEKYLRELRELAEGFDVRAYMENGDFAKQMLLYCESYGVNVKGDYPTYEMFPYKIKIDSDNQEINIGHRKLQTAKPEYLVADIKRKRDKLMRASYNASSFLEELAGAYDKLVLKRRYESQNEKLDYKLLLRDVYAYMAPMQRFRRDYDMQSFAFDLSRLYSSGIEFTKNERQFAFGPARFASQNIRILDKRGAETHVGTIIFYSNETLDETENG